MLHGKILKILSDRGITAFSTSFELRDDGAGPYIAFWRTADLGPVPTAAELAAVTDQQALDMERATLANSVDGNLLMQAVAQLDYEERQKLQVKAGQTLLTPAECKARIKAIYRGLL